MSTQTDLAGKPFWDQTWSAGDIPPPVDPDDASIWNHTRRRLHHLFRETLVDVGPGHALLELGCARSPWLPYFHRQYGFTVTGLDYSEVGAAMARAVLEHERVPGEVVCADLFAPPPELIGRFDVVTSFGVIEHFEDTVGALAAAARFLRPGGLLVTEIPNVTGVVGWLQKRMNRPVFDIHVPLDREALAAANRAAGLELLRCDYLVLAPLGTVNLTGLTPGTLTRVKTRAQYGLKLISAGLWHVELRTGLRPGRWSAGYVLSVARKP